MRYLATILLAMFAVACTESDQRQAEATTSDVGNQIESAANAAGTEIKEGYQEVKPELESMGEKAEAGLRAAGSEIKQGVHEATAPDADDNNTAPAASH